MIIVLHKSVASICEICEQYFLKFRININTIFAGQIKAFYDRSNPFRPENAYVHALSLRHRPKAKFQIPKFHCSKVPLFHCSIVPNF